MTDTEGETRLGHATTDPPNAAHSSEKARTLLYLVNVDWFFLSHRLTVARRAREAGFEIHVASAATGREDAIRGEGFIFHPLTLARGRSNLAATLQSALAMYRVIHRVRPDIVHLVTVKPVLLGGAAARVARVPKVVAAISGLGYLFIARGTAAAVRRRLAGLAYRFALGNPRVRVIFQNGDDAATITRLARLKPGQVRMIRGSGVDLARFRTQPPPAVPPLIVLLAARLLIDKGVREFIQAAQLLRARGEQVRFLVAGTPDEHNPACMPTAELAAAEADGAVEFLGAVADMPALFARAHVVVLPSYREGMPLVLLEAAAAGRAVITTDVPGCRSAIEEDTGLLVPARDCVALADAIARLAHDPTMCAQLGRNGRRLAERAFGIEDVVERHLAIYCEPL